MKLSIITINYNNSKGLDRTINSVINQTYSGFEYIVIDGNSIDTSIDIIQKYSDKIDYWISEVDEGVYDAMNKGIKSSRGDYVLFLNSGDHLFSNDILSKCIDRLDGDDLVYGNLHRIFPNGAQDFVEMPHQLGFYTFFYGTIAHPSTFIKRSLFEKFGLYREDLKIVSDWAFFLKINAFYNPTTGYLPQTISTFYMDGVSSLHTELLKEEKRKVFDEYFSKELFNILSMYNVYLNFYNTKISKVIRLISRYCKNIFSITSWVEFIHKKRYNKLIQLINKEVRKQLKDPYSIPIIIISYNRLRDLRILVSSLLAHGHKDIVIIDNNSSYKPLLEYYETIKRDVVIERMQENYGHLVFWKKEELMNKYGKGYYVVTDSDISINEGLPLDYISYLRKVLDRNKKVTKVGFALDISDIPDNYKFKEKVMKWEKQYWNEPIERNLYNAHIDTTFALYPPLYRYNKFDFFKGIRIGGKYTSKHMGWYIVDNNLDEEDMIYFKTSNSSNTWKLSDHNETSQLNELYK